MSHVPIRLPGNRSKYRAVRTNGFASKAESRRYDELVLMEKAQLIYGLETQVKYKFEIGSIHICDYIADFRYVDFKTGKIVIEDVKGIRTPAYSIKRKLMLAVHGITILETK